MSNRINEAKWLDKHNRWQIKIQKEGVRKTFTSPTPGTKGKIECEKKADKWLKHGLCDTSIRFGKAYSLFLEDAKLLTSISNCKKHDSIGTNHLLPILEHKKLSSLSQQDLQSCINVAYKKALSKKTLKNIRGTMTRFISYCKKCGYDVPTTEDLEIPRNAPVGEKKILQPDKLKLLFENNEINNNEFYIHAYRFLVLTGLRRGELCGLKKADIKNKIVNVKRSVNSLQETTDGKTQNAKRQFVLSQRMEDCLTSQSELLKKRGIISPYIFPNTKGNATNTQMLFAHWSEYRDKIGVSCSLHELRHTFISIGQADIPEQLLKRIVGHSKSMDTFGIYGHCVDGDLERVATLVDGTFDRFLK